MPKYNVSVSKGFRSAIPASYDSPLVAKGLDDSDEILLEFMLSSVDVFAPLLGRSMRTIEDKEGQDSTPCQTNNAMKQGS